MHGSSTTSVRVKYSPSANICSSWGRSVVFTFLISEFSLVVKAGIGFTDSLAKAALSSSPSQTWGDCADLEAESMSPWPPADSFFLLCLCSWSFCLRILSSLWTLTGSASLCSRMRMGRGSCWYWFVGFWRCSSTAEGMPISQSLVHLLTWQRRKKMRKGLKKGHRFKRLKVNKALIWNTPLNNSLCDVLLMYIWAYNTSNTVTKAQLRCNNNKIHQPLSWRVVTTVNLKI